MVFQEEFGLLLLITIPADNFNLIYLYFVTKLQSYAGAGSFCENRLKYSQENVHPVTIHEGTKSPFFTHSIILHFTVQAKDLAVESQPAVLSNFFPTKLRLVIILHKKIRYIIYQNVKLSPYENYKGRQNRQN